MSYGPTPRRQTQWDGRAAANFICGGAGGGLIVAAVAAGARGAALAAAMLGGAALIALGLACVWAEIGRPWRALHVFFNPRTSWMSREALVATVLLPIALAAAAGLPSFHWLAALLALAFVYCQGRILQAAKGIPAWREPLVVALIVLTGLAEGAGLWLLVQPAQAAANRPLLWVFGALLIARAAVAVSYRRRVAGSAARQSLVAIDAAGRWLMLAGTLLPLAGIALVAGDAVGGVAAMTVIAAAGLLAAGAGAWLKFALVMRAGFNQGFALAHLPVRGVRR